MSEKQTMKELIILMRDTFTGKIHVDDAITKFNQFIEETEDFEHENRIYTIEGKFKASEAEFFKWKDEMESKYNHLSGAILNLVRRVNFLNGKLSTWEQLEPLKEVF